MPAPVSFNLPTFGAAPNQYSTETALEQAVQAVLDAVFDTLAGEMRSRRVATAWTESFAAVAFPRDTAAIVQASGAKTSVWVKMVPAPSPATARDQQDQEGIWWRRVWDSADNVLALRNAGVFSLVDVAGTADAITANLHASAVSLGVTIDGSTMVEIVPAANNTGPVTLQVGTDMARAIQTETGAALPANTLRAGVSALLRRRGNAWRIVSGGVTTSDFSAERTARALADAAGSVVMLENIAGTGDAITADLPAALSGSGVAASNLRHVRFSVPAANTVAGPTLNIGGTGSVAIYDNGNVPAASGALQPGYVYDAEKINGRWRLISNPNLSGRVAALEPSTVILDASSAGTPRTANNWTVPNVLRNIIASPIIGAPAGLASPHTATVETRAIAGGVQVTWEDASGRIFRRAGTGDANGWGAWVEAPSKPMLDGEKARAEGAEAVLSARLDQSEQRLDDLAHPGDSLSFTSLIEFESGHVALAQRETGLDFIPSDEVKERIAPGLNTMIDAVQGIPLIMFSDDRVALSQRQDGIDFVPSQALINRLPIPDPNPIQKGRIQIASVNGQSHSTGGPYDSVMTLELARSLQSDAMLQVSGLYRSNGAGPIGTGGPSLYGYDRVRVATGLVQGEPGSNNIGLPFAAYATLHLHRQDAGVPVIPVLTAGHGIGGIALADMDDKANTGNGSLTVWENFTYWTKEAQRVVDQAGLEVVPGWHIFNHGGAGSRFPRGQYYDEWVALQALYCDHWRDAGLPTPRYIITQTGGATNTANDGPGYWSVADDQLDLVEHGLAVLGSCDYWHPVYDQSVHWDAYQTAIVGETLAWAMSEVEAGRRWSITRPKIVSNTGGVLILSFDSLREDEMLEVENGSKYQGQGIQHLGFELNAGTIANVTVRGKRVTIAYTGSPSTLKYARQIQDVSALSSNNYTAHRGLLRTTFTKRSKLWPDQVLVRPIPSFSLGVN